MRPAYDILGPIPVGPVRVRASVLRPGRRIELVEAVLSAADHRPGMRLTAWRMRVATDGVAPPPAAAGPHPAPTGHDAAEHLLVMTDAASGISAALDWKRATFAEVDLTVALHRPQGEWLGMDAATVLGDTGAGQCFAVLFDPEGPIGRSAQSLFVEPR